MFFHAPALASDDLMPSILPSPGIPQALLGCVHTITGRWRCSTDRVAWRSVPGNFVRKTLRWCRADVGFPALTKSLRCRRKQASVVIAGTCNQSCSADFNVIIVIISIIIINLSVIVSIIAHLPFSKTSRVAQPPYFTGHTEKYDYVTNKYLNPKISNLCYCFW